MSTELMTSNEEYQHFFREAVEQIRATRITVADTEAFTKGWSRDWLLNAIKMDSFSNNQKLIKSHNFNETLLAINADYANEVFKDQRVIL